MGGPGQFWASPEDLALRHALRNYGPAVLVDTDTYFLKPPQKLFARMKPGHAVMHLCEGQLGRFPISCRFAEAFAQRHSGSAINSMSLSRSG